MVCTRCNKEFKLIKTSKLDGFCGKCRSRQNYLNNVDKYRKTKVCICGKSILKSSKLCYSCVQLGNKNRRYTDGHSSMLRKCSCGNRISSGSKNGKCSKCYAAKVGGKGNPNYRFGHYTGEFQSTKEYKDWRMFIYKRDFFRCKICGKQHDLQAHHILPKRDFPNLVFDINNGITLCRKHHSETFKREETLANYFKNLLHAEIKLCELGESCDADTEPSHITVEGVTTRGEINSSKSAGQPLQL